MESDRISCLPDDLTGQILSRLPIKDAGRTSVLSSKWRKKWCTQPDLVFDKQCVSTIAPSEGPSIIDSKDLRIIDHVLLLHSGPINKFKLEYSDCDIIGVNFVADIDRWILHLTGRSIKELVLEVWLGDHYKIPWCLFSCQSLQHLKLYCCSLKPPMGFEGFMNLKSLELKGVTVAQDAFENMISGCPLLEILKIMQVDGLTQINIHAPNLKVFEIIAEFEDISFKDCFQLTCVTVLSKILLHSKSNQRSNLLKLFAHLPHIQSLKVSNYFLKYLAVGVDPVKLPTPFINLITLGLMINFNDLEEILVVICLLKSSPNLRKCMMMALDLPDLLTPTSYGWKNIFSEPATTLGLRHVEIFDITGTKFELDFIKFLLLYSPELEKMIVTHAEDVKPELMTELIRFKRASAKAEVIYLSDAEESS